MPPAKRSRGGGAGHGGEAGRGGGTASGWPAAAHVQRRCKGPADAVEWDVSGLRYKEDEPFSRSTVNAWLSCARCALHGPDELGAEDTALLRTAQGLHAVLSFAHAVDSPMGLLTAACSQLEQLKFVVQLPEQRVEVEMSRKGVFCLPSGETSTDDVAPDQLGYVSLNGQEVLAQPCVSRQQRLELQQAVARQVGACLHVAHLLQLRPLIDALHGFIFWAAGCLEGLLHGVLELVFTDAVFDTVLGSGTVSKEAYISSVLTLPCGLAGAQFGHSGLLKATGPLTVHDDECVCWDAELVRDFAGCAAGEIVEVQLRFKGVYNSSLTLKRKDETPSITLQMQLLLGYFVADTEDWDEIMRLNMG